jgi:hypothetical protein
MEFLSSAQLSCLKVSQSLDASVGMVSHDHLFPCILQFIIYLHHTDGRYIINAIENTSLCNMCQYPALHNLVG